MEGIGLSISLINCKVNIAKDKQKMIATTDKIVKLVKMKKLGKVVVRKGAPHLAGLSVTQIIETSHICLHGFSDTSSYMFGIESCKKFEPNKVVQFLNKKFKPEKLEINSIYEIYMR